MLVPAGRNCNTLAMALRAVALLLLLLTSIVELAKAKTARHEPRGQSYGWSLSARVKPLEYDISLNFMDGNTSFDGKVDILVEFSDVVNKGKSKMAKISGLFTRCLGEKPEATSAAESNEILLHVHNSLAITDLRIKLAGNVQDLKAAPQARLDSTQISRDSKRHLAVIRLKGAPPAGSFGVLTMTYQGTLRTEPEAVVSSKRGDNSYTILRLQNGHARELVPCLDQPQLKAKIKLAVAAPDSATVISNMPTVGAASVQKPNDHYGLNFKRTQFEQSVPMPISALAVAIGAFDKAVSSTGDRSRGLPEISVLVPRGFNRYRAKMALDIAQRCFERFREMRALPAYPLKHFQLVAVPPTLRWNMTDGLGIAIINQQFLLTRRTQAADPGEKYNQKKYNQDNEIALNVALAVARQWFGNILTPKTWSDLWITEGFAAYTALEMVNKLLPDLVVFDYVRRVYLGHALSLDTNDHYPSISHPGDYPNNDPNVSPSPFIRLRLIKSAAIIQMISRHIVAGHGSSHPEEKPLDEMISRHMVAGDDSSHPVPDPLDKMIRLLSASKSYEGIDVFGLAEALATKKYSSGAIIQILKPWTEMSGFPVVRLGVIYKEGMPKEKGTLYMKQMPAGRLNRNHDWILDDSMWPVPLGVNFYRKLNLDHFGQVCMFESVNNKSSESCIKLPHWLIGLDAALKIVSHQTMLPYFQVICSPEIDCTLSAVYTITEPYDDEYNGC
jgi:hypothetical protein